MTDADPSHAPLAEPPRRGFLRQLAAVVIGTVAVMIPAAAGLAVLLDPLRRKAKQAGFIRITSLDALPPDGSARKFQVVAAKTDAWTGSGDAPIGAVYLQRKPDQTVVAFNTRCPHAGCFVDAMPGGEGFYCPCHNSHFSADGAVQPGSPSPRGLDELEVDPMALRDGVVQVRFENFIAGVPEKKPRT
jgi:Rieske Fe-S protein